MVFYITPRRGSRSRTITSPKSMLRMLISNRIDVPVRVIQALKLARAIFHGRARLRRRFASEKRWRVVGGANPPLQVFVIGIPIRMTQGSLRTSLHQLALKIALRKSTRSERVENDEVCAKLAVASAKVSSVRLTKRHVGRLPFPVRRVNDVGKTPQLIRVVLTPQNLGKVESTNTLHHARG